MYSEDLASKKKDIDSCIFETKDITEPARRDVLGFVDCILDFTDNQVKDAIGDIGLKIKHFVKDIDTEHPELIKKYGNRLFGNKENTLSWELFSVLKTISEASKWNASANVVRNIKNTIYKDCFGQFNDLMLTIDKPSVNLQNVRFIKSEKERNDIRNAKKCQSVALISIYVNGESAWQCCGCKFDNYHRYNLLNKDISDVLNIKHNMLNCGLTSMAEKMESNIKSIEEKHRSEYLYGFCKIRLIDAAVILSKMCGYEFKNKSFGTNNKGNIITANPSSMNTFSSFSHDYFYLINDWLEYTPRIYTINEVKEMIPEDTKKIIDYLESFPEIGNKPLFDHYRILLPSLDYPVKVSKKASIHLPRERCALDISLVKNKDGFGILLGEADGANYFLNYVM